jgi:hypothetical protein
METQFGAPFTLDRISGARGIGSGHRCMHRSATLAFPMPLCVGWESPLRTNYLRVLPGAGPGECHAHRQSQISVKDVL